MPSAFLGQAPYFWLGMAQNLVPLTCSRCVRCRIVQSQPPSQAAYARADQFDRKEGLPTKLCWVFEPTVRFKRENPPVANALPGTPDAKDFHSAGNCCLIPLDLLFHRIRSSEKQLFQNNRTCGRPYLSMSLERQASIANGLLIILSCVLGAFKSTQMLGIGMGIFMGLSLIFSGVTSFCGWYRIFARMPWNRV
jgi:hypothetical protein